MSLLFRAPAPGQSRAVLERGRELSTIDRALRRARAGTGTVLVIEGEAGIGKTTLARRAVDEATAQGFRVLRAQGGELERSLPYGLVVELFGAAVRGAAGDPDPFKGSARLAAPLFAAPTETAADGSAVRADPVAYLHGLFWLLLDLTEGGPVAIVVDDAQWADEPSLRFLHHLMGRIDELPVALIVAMRPEAGSPSPAAGLVLAHREATHIAPATLSEAAVGELIAEVLGQAVPDATRHAAWVATGGNPFYVSELAADIGRSGVEEAAAPGSVLPDGVGRYVGARLARAEPDPRALAEAVAVLGDSATLHRAAALASLDVSRACSAARWLVDAAILAESETLVFRHPIVRSAVDAAIPGVLRGELRRRAALLLADDGAEIGVIGAHLREAAPSGDGRVVRLLLAAAVDALRRGEARTAVALLRRALSEPPVADVRAEVLTELARAEAAAGASTAAQTFGEALSLVREPYERAALQLELGNALVASGQWAVASAAFERALEESSAIPEELAARLEAGYLASAWVTMTDRGPVERRVRRILDAERLGTANHPLAAWIAFHEGAVVGSTAAEMQELVRRVFTEAPVEDLVWHGQTIEVASGLLLETDDLPFEVDVLSRAIDAARRDGPIGKAGVYAYCRAWPRYYQGRLTDAIADGEAALRAADLGWEAFVPAAVTVTALAHIERDDLDAAERVLAIDPDRWAGRIDFAMLVPLAQGRLRLARGDAAGAADDLRRAGDGASTALMRNTVPTDWRAWLATALLRLDRRPEAIENAREGLEIARAWGAAWPLGAALRVTGLVEGGASGIKLLREGEALLEGSPARLEYARLLMSLGVTLRRNGSITAAREALARAADLAQRIGARAILRRATDELRAAGARPRRIALSGIDALTPAELRVVEAALAGQTNREIAQALFVTPKAVEFHLANAYRKLGIGARTALAGAMGQPSAA